MAREREAMRSYVTGADHLQYTQLADGMVQVSSTHNLLKQYVMELRLDLHTPIAEVKRKLHTHNGSAIAHMELHLKDEEGAFVCKMLDDARPLGYYSVRNGMEIHVVDTDPHSLARDGGLDDVSKIAKFRMSEEEYEKRENTLRAYKKKMLAENPDFKFLPENRRPGGVAAEFLTEECIAGAEVGQRCEINPGGRRGTIAWIGKDVATLAPGYWVGVRLDEPTGKGDGSRGGVTYFEAHDKHGAFARPDRVTVGAFPTLDEELGLVGEGASAGAGAGAGAGAAVGGAGGPAAAAPTAAAAAACCGGHAHSHEAPAAGAGAATSAAGSVADASGAADGAASAAPAASTAAAPAAAAPAPAPAKTKVALKVRRRGQDADDDDDDDDEL